MTKELRTEIFKLSFYSILSGSAGALISNIDTIMVNDKLGLHQTGIYGIAFYFGSIINIPARSLSRIATSVVSETFKKNDLNAIQRLYNKSCNNQLLIGLLLFIGIWSNIDNIMHLLPKEYAEGKNVILFISAGYLVDMGTGINTVILLTSKHYRVDSLFMFFIVGVTILANYLLIPVYGITGSAIATAITISGYNLLRWMFLFVKYKLQPYDANTIKLLLIATVSFLPGYFMPQIPSLIADITVRSLLVGGLFLIMTLKFEAAPEFNNKIRKNLKRFNISL
jgi:O-antigen/teichoic acid export membrane protein